MIVDLKEQHVLFYSLLLQACLVASDHMLLLLYASYGVKSESEEKKFLKSAVAMAEGNCHAILATVLEWEADGGTRVCSFGNEIKLYTVFDPKTVTVEGGHPASNLISVSLRVDEELFGKAEKSRRADAPESGGGLALQSPSDIKYCFRKKTEGDDGIDSLVSLTFKTRSVDNAKKLCAVLGWEYKLEEVHGVQTVGILLGGAKRLLFKESADCQKCSNDLIVLGTDPENMAEVGVRAAESPAISVLQEMQKLPLTPKGLQSSLKFLTLDGLCVVLFHKV